MIFNQIGSPHRVKKNNAWNHHLDYSSWRQSKPRAPQSAVVNAMKTAPNTPGNTLSHDAVVMSKGHKEYTIWSMHFNMDKNGSMTTWKKNSLCSFLNVERLSSINSLDHEDKVNIVVVTRIYRCEKKHETKVSHHVHQRQYKVQTMHNYKATHSGRHSFGGFRKSVFAHAHTQKRKSSPLPLCHWISDHDIMTSCNEKLPCKPCFFCERNNLVNKWIITFRISSMLPLPFTACHLKCSH